MSREQKEQILVAALLICTALHIGLVVWTTVVD